MIDGIHYLNCGDWVESCTAIVENHAGEMQVLHWETAPATSETSAPTRLENRAAA